MSFDHFSKANTRRQSRLMSTIVQRRDCAASSALSSRYRGWYVALFQRAQEYKIFEAESRFLERMIRRWWAVH